MKHKIFYTVTLLTALIFTACSNMEEYIPEETVLTPSVLYSENFESGLGAFIAVNIAGDQVWVGDSRGYAFMSGYANSTDYTNEDWLISPSIDLTKQTAAHFSFDAIVRYFANPSAEATIWISDNYVEGAPSTATWTQIATRPFVDPGSWTWDNSGSGQISLTPYVGKKVNIAFKYISTATKAGSWEIKNFLVGSGEAFNFDHGKGTLSSPYDVYAALTGGGLACVQGYIAGYVNTQTANAPSYTAQGCNVKTNVLIVDDMNHIYVSNSLMLDISNAAVQTGLNLVDNPGLIGKRVTAYGTLGTNLGFKSLNAVSYYKLEDGTTGGVLPPDPILRETFASGLGEFKGQNVSGDEVWVWDRGYAKMTGYVGSVNKANEDWLISPQVDLTGVNNAKLIFEYVTRYFTNPVADCTVWISTNYVEGLPATAAWTQIYPPAQFFNANNWNFSASGIIDLSAFADKKIHLGFKYVSTDARAGTWEIKNLMIYK